jgi:L-alanine-DL-glutamate epimerase-like enolase superfamily enzyme
MPENSGLLLLISSPSLYSSPSPCEICRLVDKEGYLNLPEGPGLGVEINKDFIVA